MRSYRSDINDLYPRLVHDIWNEGERVQQRGLTTRELHPVAIALPEAERRLVTSYGRPVNVAFALAEVLWILSGRRDVEMLAAYNSGITRFSDDGRTFNAAYGYRLRHAHGFDQLDDVVRTLERDPGSRQATAVIWSRADRGFAPGDTWSGHDFRRPFDTKDRACNLMSHFMIRGGALDLLQVMRSNDVIWGLPYNLMQWTHVQEYVAARLALPMGEYCHIADSMHIYDPPFEGQEYSIGDVQPFDLYTELGCDWHAPMVKADDRTLKLVQEYEAELRTDVKAGQRLDGLDVFWTNVIYSLAAHQLYKSGDDVEAYTMARCGDAIYAAAQIRFYTQHRWHKNRVLMQFIARDYSPRVAGWMAQGFIPGEEADHG